MDRHLLVEISVLIIMLIVIVLVFINRRQSGETGHKGPGVRTLQHLALALIAPFVLILSLEKIIDPQATTAIYGVIVGYVFASWGNKDHPGE